MNRRAFLAASGALAPLAVNPASAATSQRDDHQRYFELVHYHLPGRPNHTAVRDFYRDVAIPALGRLGIGPVGVFEVVYGPNSPSLYVLISHPDLESVARTSERLLEDEAYREAGAAVLDPPAGEPAFVRRESSLLEAFSEMPTLEPPSEEMRANDARIYELRIYESHSAVAGKKKVEMFNEGGEIAIFRKTGLTPVFFGETVVGPLMPNLTYLLVFEDMAERDRAWQTFRDDPEWAALSQDPYYQDTVSNITSIILRPAPFSQV